MTMNMVLKILNDGLLTKREVHIIFSGCAALEELKSGLVKCQEVGFSNQ
jgi:hypothetical protein